MRGIVNVGNTCSLNSLLQCLFSSKNVVKYFATRPSLDGFEKDLRDLLEAYHSNESGGLIPHGFLKSLCEHVSCFVPGEQFDVCELWMMMCEAIARASHKRLQHVNMNNLNLNTNSPYADLVRKGNIDIARCNEDISSEWLNEVQGALICQTICPKCDNVTHTFEPYTMLSVDMIASDLVSCFTSCINNEQIEGWDCDKCKSTCNTTKITRFWKMPNVLCISLKRFAFIHGKVAKNNAQVVVPVQFTISQPLVIGPQRLTRQEFPYRLRAGIIHHGGAEGGHYTCVVDGGAQWYHCDDAAITPIEGEHNVGQIIQNAYFIVYDLINS